MAITYELLIFQPSSSIRRTIKASVTSSQLDRTLHPDGSAIVFFGINRPSAQQREGWFSIDSFQLDSLSDYLQLQEYIRATLEAELMRERAEWLNDADPLEPSLVWKHAKVDYVLLERRLVRTVEAMMPLIQMKNSPLPGLNMEEIEEIVSKSDKPDTRATFTVVIEVAWDEEHRPRAATFRDGLFVGLDVDNA